MGAIRMAANPPQAEPRLQLATAMRSGEHPSDAAARVVFCDGEGSQAERRPTIEPPQSHGHHARDSE